MAYQVMIHLRWVLDVDMGEDFHYAKKDNSPLNYATIRRFCLNLLKLDKNKMPNSRKFMKACLNTNYLLSLIELNPQN